MKILSAMNNADNFYFIFIGYDLIFCDNFVFPGYYGLIGSMFSWFNKSLTEIFPIFISFSLLFPISSVIFIFTESPGIEIGFL